MQQDIDYVGTVFPRRSVQVIAQLPGTISDLPIAEGQRVAAGQVIARIAAPDTAARLERIRAERERARSERDHACERYRTDRTLGEAGALAKAQVDLGKKGCEAASAAYQAADAAVAETVSVTSRSVERAPFDAVVLERIGEAGQTVAPGMPLVRLGTSELEVRVPVSERDVLRGVREGGAAKLELGSTSVRTRVLRLSPQAVGPARAREATLEFDQDALEDLVPGMSVRVSFVLAEVPDAVAVPRRALRRVGTRSVVYVVSDDRLAEHEVVVGPEEDGWVAIEPPLPGGTRVAVGDLTTLDPARPVYAVTEATP